MKRLTAKLAFVHRTLWHRETTYRWAVLLGPPPLLGCAVAALAWATLQQVSTASPTSAGSEVTWAHWTRPVAQDDQPFTETPAAALPRRDAGGHYVGFRPGWAGFIEPFTVDATMDVDVTANVLGKFTLDQPTIPLDRILDAGPTTGLFIGIGKTLFVVPTAGIYGFSAQLSRTGTQTANCIVRMGSSHHRMLRNIALNSEGGAVLKFPTIEFRLEPGLFLVVVGTGCWRGDHMVGSGELAVMVRHPGETGLTQARADEMIRPVK